jgi:hypothetical protein
MSSQALRLGPGIGLGHKPSVGVGTEKLVASPGRGGKLPTYLRRYHIPYQMVEDAAGLRHFKLRAPGSTLPSTNASATGSDGAAPCGPCQWPASGAMMHHWQRRHGPPNRPNLKIMHRCRRHSHRRLYFDVQAIAAGVLVACVAATVAAAPAVWARATPRSHALAAAPPNQLEGPNVANEPPGPPGRASLPAGPRSLWACDRACRLLGHVCRGGQCCSSGAVSSFCSACDSATGACSSCDAGYFLNAGRQCCRSDVGPACVECLGSTGLCASCAAGYYLASGDSVCRRLVPDGAACSSNQQCSGAGSCKGAVCCRPGVASSCAGCSSTSAGACSQCPASFYTDGIGCFPLLQDGMDGCSSDQHCLSGACRGNRCCQAMAPPLCTACSASPWMLGVCQACASGYVGSLSVD